MNNLKSYVSPKTPEYGYSFVAAGSLLRNFRGLGVYLRYKPGPSRVKLVSLNQFHAKWSCPDREVCVVLNTHDSAAFRPWGESWDQFVNFNVFDDYVAKSLGLPYLMTNYAHSPKSVLPRVNSRLDPEQRVTVLSDSGGLQIFRGVVNPISSLDLVTFYNNNVDAGMVLDTPIGISDDELYVRSAKLQRKNTDLMMKHSAGVELINIFHGKTSKQRSKFRSMVERPDINRCAVAGLVNQNPYAVIDQVYQVLQGLKYKQYHVLGVYMTAVIPILVAIAVKNKVHITSDSTSHIQSAKYRALHFQFDMLHTQKRLPIGTRGSLENPYKYLPCSCQVCQVIKYSDILGFGPSKFTSVLLSLHNAIDMERYAKQLQSACEDLSDGEYLKLVKTQLSNSNVFDDMKGCLDFVRVAAEDLKKAEHKYRHMLSKRNVDLIKPKGLFTAEQSDDKAKYYKILHRMEHDLKKTQAKLKP